MKKTIIFAAFAALVLASSCSERVDVPELSGENVISLDLVYGEPATRATTEGTPGENAVSSVQYFFYNDVAANPIYVSEYVQNPTLTTDLKYSVTLTAGENGVPDLTTMFMNGECIVYGVFNADEITAAPLADVKATALANTFAHEGDEAGTSTGSKWIVNLDSNQSFVMAGELALTRTTGQAYAAKGTVEMNRVAAKIAVDLKIKKEVTGKDNKVWVPMLGGNQIRLYPQNVAGAAVLGGADATNPTYPEDLDLYIPCQLREETLQWLDRDSGYLFLNRYGERITTRGVASRLAFYARKYGINPVVVHPHAFRHRYSKNFLEKHSDLALLADLLGHENIATTQIYLRESTLEQRKLIDQIVDW